MLKVREIHKYVKINTVSQVECSWIYIFKLQESWIDSDEILYCRPVEKYIDPFRLSCDHHRE
jgi:hypothetical protein